MNLNEAQVLTDELGALRKVQGTLESKSEELSKELANFLLLRDKDEVYGNIFRALLVPMHGFVWDADAIERLAKKHSVRMSRLRSTNHYNQVRTYVKKELLL